MNIEYSQSVDFEPVTVRDVRVQARIDNDVWQESLPDIDILVREQIIPAARGLAEGWLRRPLVAREVTYYVPGPICNPLKLWTTPVWDLVNISYIDGEGDEQVVAATGFIVAGKGYPAKIIARGGVLWPTAYPGTDIAVTVKAGMARSYSEVPVNVRQAVLLIAADMYENREASIVGKDTKAIYLTASKLLRQESIPLIRMA